VTMQELFDLIAMADDILARIDLDDPADGLNHQVAFIVREAVSAVKRAREMIARSEPA